jgi:hypothetical protein
MIHENKCWQFHWFKISLKSFLRSKVKLSSLETFFKYGHLITFQDASINIPWAPTLLEVVSHLDSINQLRLWETHNTDHLTWHKTLPLNTFSVNFHSPVTRFCQVWWLKSLILATQAAETENITTWSQSEQNVSEIPISTNKNWALCMPLSFQLCGKHE